MGVQLKVVERGFARKQKHELARSLKLLERASDAAIAKLEELAASKDPKIALAASDLLLSYLKQFAKDMNEDDMQRMIADVKFGGPKRLEEDDTPQIDFTTIQEV